MDEGLEEVLQDLLKKYDRRQAAGYALVHALLHDTAFDNLRVTNQLSSQTVKAFNKAKKAYL